MCEKKRKIMLGFHSTVDGKLLREWVMGLGYEVVESLDDTTGIDLVLIEAAFAHRFMDAVLKLKNQSKYFLPVLICINTSDNISRWLNAGFDDVLHLPATKDEWKARIEIMLRLRRQSEELGHKSEMLHKALVESSSDQIFMLNANGTYVTSNDRVEQFGFERGDELVGKAIDQVYPKEVVPFYRTQLQRVLNEGKTVVFEHDLPSDQEIYHHLDTLYPVNFPDGTVMVGGICRDISERKRAEEELRKYRDHLEELVKERTEELQSSNKELEAFSYSVSHDLRAPLRAIDGFTRILMEDYVKKLDDEGKRLGDIIQKNAQKMGKLIDDLLAFSRLGRTSMQFSEIDMKSMANAIYYEATSSSERKRIEFSVSDLPDAYGDSNMLHQVWMNLISNAIKFSSKREKAVISITSIQDDEKTTYQISDNGAGFDMQYVNKIFDVFQRLHGEKEFPGTGVGLSLVQRIINRHKGKIWVESEVDKGTTFYFCLPNKLD